MRALTLFQPFATAIAYGLKRTETRSWSTKYRGELAIHAAARVPPWAVHVAEEPGIRDAFKRYAGGWPEFPRSVVVALADVDTVDGVEVLRAGLDPLDFALGDYSDNRFGWTLSNVRRLVVPVTVSGALGIWKVPDAITRAIEDAEKVRVS